jgi:hypothetical protein
MNPDAVMACFAIYRDSPGDCEYRGCGSPADATLQVSDLRATVCQTHFLQLLTNTWDAFRENPGLRFYGDE